MELRTNQELARLLRDRADCTRRWENGDDDALSAVRGGGGSEFWAEVDEQAANALDPELS